MKWVRRSRTTGLKATSLSLIAFLVASALWLSCEETTEPPISDDAARTLSTFVQIDDYPFYVMRFYGDYDPILYLSEATDGLPVETLECGPTWGCTTFAALSPGGEYVLGRNFDWYNHMALLVYTDPSDGYASVAMVDLSYLGFVPGDGSDANMRRLLAAPLWPFDGMNEEGVAIGMMAVPEAEGGDDPEKPTIGSLDVIRLVLDRAKDTEEAVTVLSRYNVDFQGGPPVHYLISDADRRSVVVEYVENEMMVIPCEGAWQVATNFTVTGYVWDGSPSNCWRYNAAYNALQAASGVIDGDGAMNLLHQVSQSITMWSVVYGGGDGTISVAVGRDYAAVHEFTMEGLAALR
jgi:hypothetical protein